MFVLGMIGPAGSLGLPGPLAVAIASAAGIVARPRDGAMVAAAGCLAYLTFLSEFGQNVSYLVVVISSILWITMPWLIARAVHSLRRQVLARQNAQLEIEELYIGLEQGLMPRRRTMHPGLRTASYYRPGEQRLRIGGDFFDLTVLADGRLAVVIGDVIGHGAESAALSALLRGAWRGSVGAGVPPEDVMRVLHHVVSEEAEDVYATALTAVIDPAAGSMEAIAAGHPAPLLLSDGIHPLTVATGLPLGVGDASETWTRSIVDLPSSWTLFFYTDGLTEIRTRPGASERFDVDGLRAQLATLDGMAFTQDLLRELVDSMAAQSGAGPPDDVAIVVVSR